MKVSNKVKTIFQATSAILVLALLYKYLGGGHDPYYFLFVVGFGTYFFVTKHKEGGEDD